MNLGLASAPVRKARDRRAAADHLAARSAADSEARRARAGLSRGLGPDDGEEGALVDGLAGGVDAAAETAAARQRARLSVPAAAVLAGGAAAGLRTAAASAPRSLVPAAAEVAAGRALPARAAAWAAGRAAELVVQVSEETRRTLRASLARALARGAHPREAAREVKALVGLTDRLAGAVRRQRASLIAGGATEAEADRRAAAYADRLRAWRADNIARTEAFRAVNEGRRGLWDELVARGDVRGGEVVREWLSARDERVDDVCHELDGEQASLDGAFPGGYFEPPDPHPSCRCTILYRRSEP